MGNGKGRNIIFLIAGGYLVYLGIQIIRTGIIGGGIGDKWKWLGILCAIAFIVFGAGELILCIRKLFMSTTNDQADEALEGVEQRADEAASPVGKEEEEDRMQRSIQDMIAENRVDETADDEIK